MRTLHLYLTRQILGTMVITVGVFTFVLLLGNLLKEIIGLLVNQQTTLGLVCQAILLLIPYVWVFALPMGLLTSTLLVFGRFSADQELTAARASGISLLALVTPVLLLSMAFSVLSALFNTRIAPECRVAYKNLLYRAGMAEPTRLVPEGRYVHDFPGYIIYVRKNDGLNLRDILFFKVEKGTTVLDIRAHRGKINLDSTQQQLIFEFENAQVMEFAENEWKPRQAGRYTQPIELKSLNDSDRGPKLTDMTFQQLLQEIHEVEAEIKEPSSAAGAAKGAKNSGRKKPTSMPAQVQLHRQVSFSFACVAFTLVGIPLGIRAHRRETTAGVAMALILVLLYYSFIVLGQALETRTELAPHLLVWFPNFIFQAAGMVLLGRANRGF